MSEVASATADFVARAEAEAWKVPGIDPGMSLLPTGKVGIIGAGTMGSGIAMNFLNIGIPVILIEAQQPALERGIAVMRGNYETSARKGKLSARDIQTRMALLRGSLRLEDLQDCDLIIEAVFEEIEIKKQVFARLDKVARAGAILATNTSGLDIDQIARVTQRPESVIGLHFFSPANVMRLVEVVRGAKTSAAAIATCMDLTRRLGKVAVLVGVCPGFVGNRMLYPRQIQAERLLFEGAMPWDVDQALRDFGFRMGPFQMADLAGLDIGWTRETSKSSTLREVLCELDRRGQKTRAGYYDYDAERRPSPSAVTERIVKEFSSRSGIARRSIPATEIVERCLYPLINEGAKVLEERMATRASDIDVVWLYGYGWPKDKGGPMYYADSVGLDRVVARLREFERAYGSAFTPAPLLAKLASDGRGFLST